MSKSTLTAQKADDLEALWKLSGVDTLTDQEICERLGISINNLGGWLRRNTKVLRGEGEDAKKEGLRHIRARAKATTKSSYLQRLFSLILKAETAGDYKAAADNLRWLMEKQFPIEFGNRLKLTGRISTGGGMVGMSNKEIQQQLEADFAELAGRPECQEFVKQLKTSLSE